MITPKGFYASRPCDVRRATKKIRKATIVFEVIVVKM
jgi:hypothetical protein